jgi:hypothetical protein
VKGAGIDDAGRQAIPLVMSGAVGVALMAAFAALRLTLKGLASRVSRIRSASPSGGEEETAPDAAGPPRSPSLLHSARAPYRPVIRIEGNQKEIVSDFQTAGIQLSDEMQGDRIGCVEAEGRSIPFGLIITRSGTDELFVEIWKDEAYDRNREPVELQSLHQVLRDRIHHRMEILERQDNPQS